VRGFGAVLRAAVRFGLSQQIERREQNENEAYWGGGSGVEHDSFLKDYLQRIEKPNGLEQLGSSIRWKKLALF
jgi:hypothetical protein